MSLVMVVEWLAVVAAVELCCLLVVGVVGWQVGRRLLVAGVDRLWILVMVPALSFIPTLR